MSTIAASAEIKYAQLEQMRTGDTVDALGGSLTGAYGRLYLQKIVQIQFNLPPSAISRMPELLRESSSSSETRLRQSDSVTATFSIGRYVVVFVVTMVLLLSLLPYASDFVAQTIFASEGSTQDASATTLEPWVWIPAALGALYFVWEPAMAVRRDYQKFQARKTQDRIDQAIRQAIADGIATADELMHSEYLSNFLPKDRRKWRTLFWPPRPLRAMMDRRYDRRIETRRGLLFQRIQRILADESASRKQAEAEILEYLPGLPRSAKRLFNHLRILLVVAEQKRMFGGDPELEAKHIGKWAVLLERWPELGSALTSNPARIADLEEAASLEELSKHVGVSIPGPVISQDLFRFLKSPTKLGPIAERLVFFQPAQPRQDDETSPDEHVEVKERGSQSSSISPATRVR